MTCIMSWMDGGQRVMKEVGGEGEEGGREGDGRRRGGGGRERDGT